MASYRTPRFNVSLLTVHCSWANNAACSTETPPLFASADAGPSGLTNKRMDAGTGAEGVQPAVRQTPPRTWTCTGPIGVVLYALVPCLEAFSLVRAPSLNV